MKQSATPDIMSNFNKGMLDKVLAIEKDVMELKLTVLKKLSPTGKKVLKLKGILKGTHITDDDIKLAKSALYSKIGL